MKIINIMLASGKGGLEQMSTTYTKALVDSGHYVTSIIAKDCPYKEYTIKHASKVKLLESRSKYNIVNTFKLINFIKKEKAEVVICHGNRAMSLILNSFVRFWFKPQFKTIGVMHSKKCPYVEKCDNLIFLTEPFKQEKSQNIQEKSFVLANTILGETCEPKKLRLPVTFGSFGRLHEVKGYDILLESLAILKDKGYNFKFVLGGDGPDKEKLLEQVKNLNLEDIVEYYGWVADKKDFFDKIDVFCLSSRSERMPLTVLEAFFYSKAVISVNLEGPVSVLNNLQEPIIANVEDAEDFSKKMEYILNNTDKITAMSQDGYNLFINKYSFDKFTKNLNKILEAI